MRKNATIKNMKEEQRTPEKAAEYIRSIQKVCTEIYESAEEEFFSDSDVDKEFYFDYVYNHDGDETFAEYKQKYNLE